MFYKFHKSKLFILCRIVNFNLFVSFQIEPSNGNDDERDMKLFPDQTKLNLNITCHALTTDFLIYATDVRKYFIYSFV